MNNNKKIIKKQVIGTFTGKCCDATLSNNNDMYLGTKLFENLFSSEDYKRAMKYRHYIGFLGHPEDPGCMDYEHACIVMTECHIDNDGQVYGTFDLIDTPVGKVVKSFIDAGVTFGISIRGAGDVSGDGEVDPETFIFRGFDLVTFPAYDDAIPTFQEIAASSDLDKQVKYKKVCSTINKNLNTIKSSTVLDTIQEQFNQASKEYQLIESRKSELLCSTNVDVESDKVAGMTTLYLEQVAANTQLHKELNELKRKVSRVSDSYQRRVNTLKKISAAQITNMESELSSVTASYKVAVKANRAIKKQIASLESAKMQLEKHNLKYTHKIEANSKTISERDSIISDLETKLRKTVTASNQVENRASNLDEEIRGLRSRVAASEQMILAYQQAYANMYANALGVHLDNLSVTSSTTVEDLRSMISGATNTSGMMTTPFVEPIPVEVVDEEDEENMVTM